MSISDIVKALMESGATPEMTLAAIRACEQSAEEKKIRTREAARLRKQKSRSNVTVTSVTSRDKRDIAGQGVTSVTECDKSASPPCPPPNGFPYPSLTPPYNPPQPKILKDAQALLTFTLPDWIPNDVWSEFIAIRKKLKAVNSVHALESIVRKLDSWRQQGHDPTAIIEKSITSSWKDVFEPKENHNASTINNSRQYPKKPSWRSTGETLSERYEREAQQLEREEAERVKCPALTDMRAPESIREDGG